MVVTDATASPVHFLDQTIELVNLHLYSLFGLEFDFIYSRIALTDPNLIYI